MTAPGCLHLLAMALAAMVALTPLRAEDDVTVISNPDTTIAPKKVASTDGTPVVHKSLHKKKHHATATASANETAPATTAPATETSSATAQNKPAKKSSATTSASTTHSQPVVATTPVQPPVTAILPPHPQYVPPVNTASAPTAPLPTVKSVATSPTTGAAGPTVETGLPVARYPGMGTPIRGVSTYIPMPGTLPPAKTAGGTNHTYYAGALPSLMVPLTSSAAGSYSSPNRTVDGFVFANFSRKPKVTYPWKTGIITTMFWIGEGDTPISRTTNEASSWDEDWRENNHGTDSPYNRNGYASGSHASTLNPFYVALPFNDLAFPDKARQWLPRGWYRRPKDGKQVSACKDRWVEIKNQRGDYCYAQWEDVGPLRYDHAEYVFGDERPIGLGDNHAGLDVSPAVAQYLGIDGKDRAVTSWRFVDDEDVRPGAWLKLDEQAVIFTALHQMKNSNPADLPIQRATEPIDDQSNIETNKKKIDQSKG